MVPALLLALGALPSVQIDVPFVQQKPDFCGEADVEMALRHFGQAITQDQVFEASGLEPLKGRGVHADELAAALRRLGREPGQTWYRVDPAKAGAQLEAQWQALHQGLLAGAPSIVCMHYDDSPDTTEHFRLVTGYDAKTDEVIYQEPAEANGANRQMARAQFLKLWPFKPAKDRWTVIRLTVGRGEQFAPLPKSPGPTPAELAQHVMTLKETLPAGMTLAWEPPFLVIGDEPPAQVRQRAKTIVGWTRELLLKDFFPRAPSELHEVWILKDAASYQRTSRTLFNYAPDTPYGYYLGSRRALVMNIKPGYGTLTHELVHPFMREAWPEAPAWLNEGVASLFEFPFEDDGHLKGRVNWRLPALKAALAQPKNQVPSFFVLTHFDTEAFYADPEGLYYASARYLCYWLQEQGLLPQFVRRALELQAEDPTGWRALTEVLGKDPTTLRAEWERYVLGLQKKRPPAAG